MREQFLKIRGSSIFVKTMGSGTPLLFLHGGPGGEHRFFLPHVEELANFYQLIFYDQRGCGQSECLQDESEYTIKEEIEALEELRIHLDIEKLNIVGESWGSMLALCYATTYHKNVNKVILTAAVGATGAGLSEFGKELDRRLTESDRDALESAIKRLNSGTGTVDEIFTVLDPYYVYNPEALTRKTKTVSNEVVNRILGAEITSTYDIRETLHKLVNIPVLVLQGKHDLITPTMLEELLLQYIPNKTLVVLENCGHWTIVEQPERFNREVRKFIG
ncbi:alpha/beta fold hydrolase [Fredinandcohnia sp. 179-A 10B2 NHS]|uniref:alpha/beta fold hydrolase n=1 Tax=Fredinandcohnia sp. 179-A 10B2 NHS TaxID=3235176 RepID=UPI00399FA19E